MKKLTLEELRDFAGAWSFAPGYKPDADGVRNMLKAFGTEADDADIDIVLEEVHAGIDQLDSLMNTMFNEDGSINPEGMKSLLGEAIDNMFGDKK